ncbi:uncharacterized protein UTRI_10201 [Ustilago trichophora]|uniref:Uncharacterized protein n=1 Tax=Ustilago trichophora TaxID=86804 RepID=A0A5C3EGF0_9BASI|nr:uncharacterized protein UTRI_10201 [Ustilago trichophora]
MFTSIRSVSLFGLLSLAIILPFLCAINAHEDPAEAESRRLRAQSSNWVHSQPVSSTQIHSPPEVSIDDYRSEYPFRLQKWPEPKIRQKLQTYPTQAQRLVDDLQYFGTADWNPTDNLKTHLKTFDAAITRLTLGPFHPKTVEQQPPSVREMHYDVLGQFTSWLNTHRSDLDSLEGTDEARKRVGRYERALRAADIARALPYIE